MTLKWKRTDDNDQHGWLSEPAQVRDRGDGGWDKDDDESGRAVGQPLALVLRLTAEKRFVFRQAVSFVRLWTRIHMVLMRVAPILVFG